MAMMDGGPVSQALRVSSLVRFRKTRCLPADGDVLVEAGESVLADSVIARLRRAGPPEVLNIAKALGIRGTGDVARYLLKSPGDAVKAGDMLALRKGTLGIGQRTVASPIDGVVASGPTSWGELLINPLPDELEVHAQVPGVVLDTIPGRGAVIEGVGAYIQGIAFAGGDTRGTLEAVVSGPDSEITSESIAEDCDGAVVFGGQIGPPALRTASVARVRAVVVGSVTGSTFRWLLDNPQPLTVIVTDAFGLVPMARQTFELLSKNAGQTAVVFASTKTGGGDVPAEIIVPYVGHANQVTQNDLQLREGSTVRVTRGPYFGVLGRVTRLPEAPRVLKSGVRTQVVEVETDGGAKILVGRPNVELVG